MQVVLATWYKKVVARLTYPVANVGGHVIAQLPSFVRFTTKHNSIWSKAEHIDAFSLDWSNTFMYLYPPFSLVARTLVKLRRNLGEGILVAPLWPTQNWWIDMMELLIDQPFIIPVTEDMLIIPNKDSVHPLVNQFILVAFESIP